jgi:transposase-like protein
MDKGIIANFECPDCGKKWNTLFDSDAKKFVDHCTTKPKCLSDRKPVESYDRHEKKPRANRMKFEDGNMVPTITLELAERLAK